MSLHKVLHQGHAQSIAQRALSRDRVPHAYIFHGPAGVGRELFAHGLAQRLLCGSPTSMDLSGPQHETVGVDALSEGCGACHDCTLCGAGTHPDVHLVHRHLNREHPDPGIRKRKGLDISVDVVRHFVIDKAALSTARGQGKVFIIREADRITPAAQNAMLKTLEEPPAGTFIILLVESLDRLLPTTLSRCQSVRFDLLPAFFVEQQLRDALPDLSDAQRSWYATMAGGSVGRGMDLVEEGLYEFNQRVVDSLLQLARQPGSVPSKAWVDEAGSLSNVYKKRDAEISDTEATRRGLKALLLLVATWFADVLRVGGGSTDRVVNQAHLSALQSLAGIMPLEASAEVINAVSATERRLDLNVNTQLCLDALQATLHQHMIRHASMAR